MPNDAYEHMKMLLNINKNAKIVVECELRANVRFLAVMNAFSRYWSSIHVNECVFSRNEQHNVYYVQEWTVGREHLQLGIGHGDGGISMCSRNVVNEDDLLVGV